MTVLHQRTDNQHREIRQPPVYDARDLTRTGDVAQIVLDDQTYVLRITRAGKLILTK